MYRVVYKSLHINSCPKQENHVLKQHLHKEINLAKCHLAWSIFLINVIVSLWTSFFFTCFLPPRCSLKANSSLHHNLHSAHHFGLFGASTPCLLISSICNLALCFWPWKCILSKSSFIHGMQHTSHHCIWLLLPPFCNICSCFRPLKCCLRLDGLEQDIWQILQYISSSSPSWLRVPWNGWWCCRRRWSELGDSFPLVPKRLENLLVHGPGNDFGREASFDDLTWKIN